MPAVERELAIQALEEAKSLLFAQRVSARK
jgi:hypothetical protein